MGITRAGVLAAVFALLVAAVCVRLGFWQLDRLEQLRERNAAISAARALPPINLGEVPPDSLSRYPASFEHRQATATGAYLLGSEFLLRGRAFQGSPGVHLYSFFRLEGSGPIVLVNRGWLPAADGATADPRDYRTSEPTVLLGTLHPLPAPGADRVPAVVSIGDTTVTTYLRVDRSILPDTLRVPPLYLQLLPDSATDAAPSLPAPIPPDVLDEGPHLGYAIQWFSFAAIAVGGFIVAALTRRSRARS